MCYFNTALALSSFWIGYILSSAPLAAHEEGHMYVPESKTYSEVMTSNAKAVENFMDVILSYADKACKSIQDGLIIIADYCTADGKNSLPLILKIIGLIREHSQQAEIMVVFEDYCGNDYNALFHQVQKADTLSYNGVFAMASSTSMYKQCLPSSSAQFIFSFNGLYHLSKRPGLVKTSMLPGLAEPDEKLVFQKQAESDWKLFLSQRSKELKPGGMMFIIPSATQDDDIYYQLDKVLKSLLEDKVISQVEFANISLNEYMRSEEELKQPFDEGAEEVKDLQLVSFELVKHTIYKNETGVLGRERALMVMELTRTFTYNPIFDNLSENRTKAQRKGVTDEFFKRFVNNYQGFTKDVFERFPRLVIQKKI